MSPKRHNFSKKGGTDISYTKPESNTSESNNIQSEDIPKKRKKKVNFPRNFVKVIDVESYKKYNQLNTITEPVIPTTNSGKDKVFCKCFIF